MNTRLLEILADSFPKILIPGLTVTIPLTAISFSLAMVIAVAMALVQFARVPVLTQLCRFYIWVFRGTPLLVQLFTVFFGMPKMGIRIDPFPAAVIVFSLNEGAYCAETVRAALESVPAGQLEAGGGAEEAKLLREQIHQLTPAPWEENLITKLISSGSQPAEI